MAAVPMGDLFFWIQRLHDRGTSVGHSDGVLLERFANRRDEEAFAILVGRHGPMVLAVCRGVLKDPRDAEDAFQATFLVLVSKARSLWVRGSLGAWLHKVAHRVAVRASILDARRVRREGIELPREPVDPRGFDDRRERSDDVHAELARLPEPERSAVVLCLLEGRTHAQAAQELGCGEATLRRRLARARERLRVRLERRGVAPAMALKAIEQADLGPVPRAWTQTTCREAISLAAGARPTTAAGVLGALVTRQMLMARRVRLGAWLCVGLSGLAVAAAIGPLRPAGPPEAQGSAPFARQQPDEGPSARPPSKSPRWAHIRFDTGMEKWIDLTTARHLWRYDGMAGLRDPQTNSDLSYRGKGPIERREQTVWFTGQPRPDLQSLLSFERLHFPEVDQLKPGRAPEVERREYPLFYDREVETLNGRRCLRLDKYTRDTLGQARMVEQTWVDLETRLPLRQRELMQLADQGRYHREYRTGDWDYSDRGPADLFAIGVPAGTPIVAEVKNPRAALPAEIQRAIRALAEAIRRFPPRCRIVVDDEAGFGLCLYYWSSPKAFIDARCDAMTNPEDNRIYSVEPPRSFFANIPDLGDFPPDVRQALDAGPGVDLPADLLATWFRTDAAMNLRIGDGKRSFALTRVVPEPGKPARIQLHVLRDTPQVPDPLQELWEFAFLANLAPGEPEPGTPPGQIVIRAEYDTVRECWYCDPAHDFIVARRVMWSKEPGGWVFRSDDRVVRWKQLAGGSWYAAAREHRTPRQAPKPSPEWVIPEGTQFFTKYQRTEITPAPPAIVPADAFDGEKVIANARRENATIHVD